MTKLRKFLFILFIFSILAGHGIAEANNAGKKVKQRCKQLVQSRCSGLKGAVPFQSKPAKVKNCNLGFKSGEKKGLTYLAFIKNVPKQKAAREASGKSNKLKACDTVKQAHKTCQIVAKRGKTILKDKIFVFDNNGEQKCEQARKQVSKNWGETTKPTNKVVREDEKFGAKKGKLQKKQVMDVRKTGIVSKVIGKKVAK